MADSTQRKLQNTDETEYHQPHSVEELTETNIRTIARLEDASRSERKTADRVADAISAFCGGMRFVYVHIVWFVVWIVLNIGHLTPKNWHFDPFPFQFLTLMVSLEAIFLSTFILISQNRQGRIAERRNHLDLQINLLAEQENSKMLSMLEAIQKHLGIESNDPDIQILEESTRPDKLIDQIETIIEKREQAKRDE